MQSENNRLSIIPVKAVVRCRPLIPNEVSEGCVTCLEFVNAANQVTIGGNKHFTFDAVFDPDACQEDVYTEAVKPLTKGVFEGYHATVLAYGQTGSGKTYSMGSACSSANFNEQSSGIIPRVISDLFHGVASQTTQDFSLKVSYLEIYKEEIIDLLCPPAERQQIIIRDGTNGCTSISGLTELTVNSAEDTLKAMERGNGLRTTAATAMNATSSRSHAIFTVIVDFHEKGDPNNRIVSKFHLVDLAGSERAKRTKAEGERLQEGIKINKGLLALGNVISALADENSRSGHIKYRDSKLTRMLQSSLGGNSHTVMIACVSPADSNYEETLNTLRYADRVRRIKNKPVINRDPQAAQICALKQEIQSLQLQLLDAGIPTSGIRSGPSVATHAHQVEALKDENSKLMERLQMSVQHHAEMCEKVILVEAERDGLREGLIELFNCSKAIARDHPNLSSNLDTNLIKQCFSRLVFLQELVLNKHNLETLTSTDNSELCEDKNYGDEEMSSLADDGGQNVGAAHVMKKADLGKKLQELSKALSMKEELAKKMCHNDDKMTVMCEHYEAKLQQLDKNIKNLVREKSSLEVALQEAHKSKESQKISEKRRKRLIELSSQINELKKEKKEKEKLMRLKAESDRTVVRLNKEIHDMKRTRVNLMRQIKDESEKFNAWKKEKAKEVKQLQEKNRKRNFEYVKLERSYDKQKAILRRKTEEAAAANKRLKLAIGKQQAAAAKKGSSEGRVLDKSAQKIRSWLDEEIEVLCSVKEVEHHLGQLLEDRRMLSHELQDVRDTSKKRRRTYDADDLTHDTTTKRMEMKRELELKNAQIRDLQDKLADVKENQQVNNRWSRIGTIADAKCALKYLLHLIIVAKTSTFRSEAELKNALREKEAVETLLKDLEVQVQELEIKYLAEKTLVDNAHQEELSFLMCQINGSKPADAPQSLQVENNSPLESNAQMVTEKLDGAASSGWNTNCTPVRLNGKSFFQPLSEQAAGKEASDDYDDSYVAEDDSGSEYQPTPKRKKGSMGGCSCKRSKTLCGSMLCGCVKRGNSCSSDCRCLSNLCQNKPKDDQDQAEHKCDGDSYILSDKENDDPESPSEKTRDIETGKENYLLSFTSQLPHSKETSSYSPMYFDSPLADHVEQKQNIGKSTPNFFFTN